MKILDRLTPTTLSKEKPLRVSFASSPDKTIGSTPPSSPSYAAHTRAGGTHKTDDAIRDPDADLVQGKSAKATAVLRVNKILCRVPSHESNISDLSASLSPNYVRAKPQEQAKEENPLYALMDVCGMEEIRSLLASEQGEEQQQQRKQQAVKKWVDLPAIWGLPPSSDQDGSDADEPDGNADLGASVEYENIELVLDESPPPPSSGRRSPFSGNGILKKKVSGIVKSGRYSPKMTETVVPSVTASPGRGGRDPSPTNSDHRITHMYDLASFQNEMLRPSPAGFAVDNADLKAATAAAASAAGGEVGSGSPVDSVSGKLNQVDAEANGAAESKKKKGKSKGSKTSKTSVASKDAINSTAESDESEEKNSTANVPSRNFLKGLSLKMTKSSKKGTKDEAEAEKAQETADSAKAEDISAEPTKKKRFGKKKSVNPAAPTAETIEDAKHWKAAFDSASSQTYYYHSKTKATSWEKPAGFDEAQKIKEENKCWKATVDPDTKQTYYYHSKTKEVSWTKPEGFVEKKKKKKVKDAAGEELTAAEEKKDSKVKAVNAEGLPGEELTAAEDATAKSSPVVEPADVVDEVTADITTAPVTQEKAAVEPKVEEQVSNDPAESVDSEPEQEDASEPELPHAVKRVQSIEDAPFDEPLSSNLVRQDSPIDNTDDDTFGSLPSITNAMNASDMKPIDFTNRTKTFMSQMTDKTPKFNNTTATSRTKDFTNTHIDVNVTTSDFRAVHDDGDHPSSIDSSIASVEEDSPKNTKMPQLGAVASLRADAKSKSRQASANDIIDEEESAVFDDWSDEVSELSGIGNEEKAVMKKMPNGRNRRKSKSSRDTRADKSSTRHTSSNQSSRNSSDKKYSQEELDGFIAKDDWGSVSKYIAEMRNNKQNATRNQPSPREIQDAIEYNRRVDISENGPKKGFGAKSQIQHNNADDYSESTPESDSRSSSSFDDSTFDEETPRRSPLPQSSRKRVT